MSYLEPEEASALVKEFIGECKFLEIDEDTQRIYLKRASGAIDFLPMLGPGMGYEGKKAVRTQEHEFPRHGTEIIPEAVKLACIIEACNQADGEARERMKIRRQGVTGVSIGSVKENYAKLSAVDSVMSREAFYYLLPYINRGHAAAIV